MHELYQVVAESFSTHVSHDKANTSLHMYCVFNFTAYQLFCVIQC